MQGRVYNHSLLNYFPDSRKDDSKERLLPSKGLSIEELNLKQKKNNIYQRSKIWWGVSIITFLPKKLWNWPFQYIWRWFWRLLWSLLLGSLWERLWGRLRETLWKWFHMLPWKAVYNLLWPRKSSDSVQNRSSSPEKSSFKSSDSVQNRSPSPERFSFKDIILFYNDQKLNTESALHVIEKQILLKRHACESIFIDEKNLSPKTRKPDLAIFVYYISNAREHFERIKMRVNKVSALFPEVRIHLLLLKDEYCDQWPIDRSQLQKLDITVDYFSIYSPSYAQFALCPEKMNRSITKQKYTEVKRNYEELCEALALRVSCLNS